MLTRVVSGFVITGMFVAIAGGQSWVDDGADGNWSTPDNWFGGVAPSNDGSAQILFSVNDYGFFSSITPNVDVPWAIDTLAFDGSFWASSIHMTGSEVTLFGGLTSTSYGSSFGGGFSLQIDNSLVLGADQTWLLNNGSSFSSPTTPPQLFSSIDLSGRNLLLQGYGNAHLGALTGSGTLVMDGTGTIDVSFDAGWNGLLRVHQGTAYLVATPPAGSIELAGGAIAISQDLNPAGYLAPGSTEGWILLDQVTSYTAGGTGVLDFSTLPGGSGIGLGAIGNSSLDASLTLIPDATGTLRFGGGTGTLNVPIAIADGPVPTHLLFDGSGRTNLDAGGSFSGEVVQKGGTIYVNAVDALGSTSGKTLVESGNMWVMVPTDEHFEVHGGQVVIREPANASFDVAGGIVLIQPTTTDPVLVNNSITLRGGGVTLDVKEDGELVTPVILADGKSSSLSTYVRDNPSNPFRITGGVSGQGNLVLDGLATSALAVQSALNHTGDTTITGRVYNDSPQDLNGRLILSDGVGLTLNAPMAVDALVMKDGSLEGTEPLTLRDPVIHMTGGDIDLPGGLVGATSIVMNGLGWASIIDIGTQSTPTLDLQRGQITLAGQPQFNGPIEVAQDGALMYLVGNGGQPITQDIHLNNGTGIGYSGSLGVGGLGGSRVNLAGDVYLGDTGALIGTGGLDRTLQISGTIHGGQLVKVGDAELEIAAGGHTYTGPTIVREGILSLSLNGRLESTSSINVEYGGVLDIDQSDNTSTVSNTIADTVTVNLQGGILQTSWDGYGTAPAYPEERIGTLRLARGGSVIRPQNGGFEIGTLQRDPGATLIVEQVYLSPGTETNNLTFTTPPTLVNGILGPWAVGETFANTGIDFLTYDPVVGVKLLPETGRPTDINTATADDHVILSGNITMAADTTVDTLYGIGYALDLDGHVLTVRSGGIINRGMDILNGQMAVGPGVTELIIHHGGGTDIYSADIGDGTAGPLSLVVSPLTSDIYIGSIDLYGNNTYTGDTIVNNKVSLDIWAASAVPSDNNVIINGGKYTNTAVTEGITLRDIIIRYGGTLSGNGITADNVFVESGMISADLQGATPITKTSTGTLQIRYGEMIAWTGTLDIQNGIVEVFESRGLGNGTAIVHPGGKLVMTNPTSSNSTFTAYGHIVLNGGELYAGEASFWGISDLNFNGVVEVTADSSVLTHNPYRLYEHDIQLRGELTLADGVILFTDGPGSVSIRGSIDLGQGGSLLGGFDVRPFAGESVTGEGLIEGSLTISDAVVLAPGHGTGELVLQGDYTQTIGGALQIEIAGTNNYDSVNVIGNAEIAGTLEVALLGGYSPALGDSFDILDWGSIVGNFTTLNLPTLGINLDWDTTNLLIDGSLSVISLSVPGDLDGDGFVGIADLDIVLGNWNLNVPPGNPLADPSGNGFVGITDLNFVLGNWNAGTPPSQITSVPEPASLAVFGFAALASVRRR